MNYPMLDLQFRKPASLGKLYVKEPKSGAVKKTLKYITYVFTNTQSILRLIHY